MYLIVRSFEKSYRNLDVRYVWTRIIWIFQDRPRLSKIVIPIHMANTPMKLIFLSNMLLSWSKKRDLVGFIQRLWFKHSHAFCHTTADLTYLIVYWSVTVYFLFSASHHSVSRKSRSMHKTMEKPAVRIEPKWSIHSEQWIIPRLHSFLLSSRFRSCLSAYRSLSPFVVPCRCPPSLLVVIFIFVFVIVVARVCFSASEANVERRTYTYAS